jgi:hypothetical protein
LYWNFHGNYIKFLDQQEKVKCLQYHTKLGMNIVPLSHLLRSTLAFFLWQYEVWTQGFLLARQILYCLTHASSSTLAFNKNCFHLVWHLSFIYIYTHIHIYVCVYIYIYILYCRYYKLYNFLETSYFAVLL